MVVMLFGMIAERAEVGTLELNATNMEELRDQLALHIDGLNDLSYSIAVDRSIVHGEIHLTGKEEIAVLPPFAGG
ncbi:MAG: MoaD/ThiS family protein [Flavobacteriales bacterium]|nr:MoaD/ThiS family protein [Flavobacteriales bacterium]